MSKDEFRKCLYCRHFSEGKCYRLSSALDLRGSVDLALNVYVENEDIRTQALEKLHYNAFSVAEEVLRYVEAYGRMSMKNKAVLKNAVIDRLEAERIKFVGEAQDLAEDVALKFSYKDEGVEVDRDFYCAYWE